MSKKKRPRFIQRIYAFLHAYYWLPCTICGEYYGGHEAAGTLMTSSTGGVLVCPDCAEEAEKRNRARREMEDHEVIVLS